jgi:hypothetical protein
MQLVGNIKREWGMTSPDWTIITDEEEPNYSSVNMRQINKDTDNIVAACTPSIETNGF